MLANYEPFGTMALLIIFVPMIIFAIYADKKKQKDLREGRIKGIKPSRNFFDWMFYSYRD